MRITDLPANNPQAALDFALEHVAAGTWRDEYGSQLLRMNPEPAARAELEAGLRRLAPRQRRAGVMPKKR